MLNNMVLKTFNVADETYSKFASICKSNGMSMSKQVDLFMESFVKEEPIARKEYLEKLSKIRAKSSLRVGSLEDFKKRY